MAMNFNYRLRQIRPYAQHAAEEHRSVQHEVVHAIEDYLARRQTEDVKADPEALCALAEARESVRAGDVVYRVEAARALIRDRHVS
ncbi:MAG: hypothetical protein ABI384_07575 [Allobranchiibius sp.]